MASTLPTRDFEDSFFDKGYKYVVGVDEVGRGAIAGPVSVGAVLLKKDFQEWPEGVKDSKSVSEKKRETLHPLIQEWVDSYSVASSTASFIDTNGIVEALAVAAVEAILKTVETHPLSEGIVILDGSHNWLKNKLPAELKIVVREKADRDCISVSAASLLAKVERDRFMIDASDVFPGYGWESNKGYGAKTHYEGIKKIGIVEGLHRTTWIKNL